MPEEGNPLAKMGLGRQLVSTAARSPQMLIDLIERQRNNIALTFHPDTSQGNVDGPEFVDLLKPFSQWNELEEGDREHFLADFLRPPTSEALLAVQYLGNREEAEQAENLRQIEELTRKVSQLEAGLHKANTLMSNQNRMIGNLKSKMTLFNPNRNLEVSGLAQLARTISHGRRESGGNINRLNGYCFFGRTTFVTKKLRFEILPEAVLVTELAKVEEVPDAPVKKGRKPAGSYRYEDKVVEVQTAMYFVRSDTALMVLTITKRVEPGSYWESEADALQALSEYLPVLHDRAILGDFTPPALKGVSTTPWKFQGHVLGQVDRPNGILKVSKKASEGDGWVLSPIEIADRLEMDLARTIQKPKLREVGVEPLALITVEPLVGSVRELDDEIDIRYRYRHVKLHTSAMDPYFLSPQKG